MPIGAVFNFAGGLLNAGATKDAANTSAAAITEAAKIAAEAQKFRPVGVTTRFGKSNFEVDDKGYLKSAGYELSPELKAYQDRVMKLTGKRLTEAELADQRYASFLPAAERMFNLGSQYLAESPEEVAARYMQKQQDLLAPGRERRFGQLQNQLFQTGRGGLSVGATGTRPGGGQGLSAANPEMEAYYNALAQQDIELASKAEQAGRDQLMFGTGLYSTGGNLLNLRENALSTSLSPFTTTLGGVSTIESLGQQPLDISAQLGGKSATAGANVGNSLLQGGLSAAKTAQAGNAINPWATVLQGAGSNPRLSGALNEWIQSQGRPAPPAGTTNYGYGWGGGTDFSVIPAYDQPSYVNNASSSRWGSY